MTTQQWIDPYTCTVVAEVPGSGGYSRRSSDLNSPEIRHTMIAEAAYFKAQRRGFAPGHELEDWLAAEAEMTSEHPAVIPQAT